MEKSIDFQEFQSIAKGVLKQICAYCDANDLEYLLFGIRHTARRRAAQGHHSVGL